MYAAKNTLRGESVFRPPQAGKTRGSERIPIAPKGLCPFGASLSKLGSLPVRRLDRVEAGIAERAAFEGVDTGDRAAAGAADLVFQ